MYRLKIMKRQSILGIVICLLGQNTAARSQEQCANMNVYGLPSTQMEITLAEWRENYTPPPTPFGAPVSAVFPPHCHVEGVIDRRTGADGKPYAIGFAVNLPDDWNGRFLFQGGGGLNGTLQPPLGLTAAGGTPALARGFAVASTDSGHQAQAPFDAAFFADQEAMLNFHQFANARVTIIARQIVADYYGREADYSYFVGCSTGGREGMIMSQRFPFYYDGIVAGAPAMRTGFSNLALKWVSVSLNQAAQKDAAGKPLPNSTFSETDKQLIIDTLLQTCDGRDGVTDGLVFDVSGCDFDPDRLVCKSGKNDSCLSAAQARALKQAFAGPKNAAGSPVYTGFPYDTGIATGGFIPGLLGGGTSPVDPAGRTALEQDVDAEARAASDQSAAFGDSTWTNLTSFSGNDGKLIFYHGVSDAWFSALDTIDYYRRMSAANGGMDQVRNWSRAYLVPGMLHCNGGQALDRFDLLTAIVDWVENEKAPDRVTATGRAYPGRSRPLCPYPEFAHYTGNGDSEAAENFDCRD
jgi:feruloyl esterase